MTTALLTEKIHAISAKSEPNVSRFSSKIFECLVDFPPL
jgi:hypothetical protein